MSKEGILAPCGIECTGCPAYQATLDNDLDWMAEILGEWTTDDSYVPEDLICDGCHGPRISRDCRVCWVKDCVEGKGIQNCAQCDDYPCDRLVREWGTWNVLSPGDAKARLDKIRESLSPDS